jgi:hypothetical protein
LPGAELVAELARRRLLRATLAQVPAELSPNLGDGLIGQAAATLG